MKKLRFLFFFLTDHEKNEIDDVLGFPKNIGIPFIKAVINPPQAEFRLYSV